MRGFTFCTIDICKIYIVKSYQRFVSWECQSRSLDSWSPPPCWHSKGLHQLGADVLEPSGSDLQCQYILEQGGSRGARFPLHHLTTDEVKWRVANFTISTHTDNIIAFWNSLLNISNINHSTWQCLSTFFFLQQVVPKKCQSPSTSIEPTS